MDDDDRCLSDVIGDPLALEFFLQRSAEDDRKVNESLGQAVSRPPVVAKRPAKPRRKVVRPTVPAAAPSTSLVLLQDDEAKKYLATTNPNANAQRQVSVSSAQLTQHQQQHRFFLQSNQHGPPTASPVNAPSFLVAGAGPPATAGATTSTTTKSSPMPPPPPTTQSPGVSHRSPSGFGQPPVSATPPPAAPPQNTTFYSVRSPAASSSPLPAGASYVQVASRSSTPSTMPPSAAIVQHRSASQSPITIPVPSTSTSTVLSGGQIMQFIQAPLPHHAVHAAQYRSHPAKPKQPQQILPKPASGVTTVQQSHRPAARGSGSSSSTPSASAGVNPAGSALVLSQGQMLANASNMAVGPQGTHLLLNHFSLHGVGQNQILIPTGGHGLPHNLQLVVRPNLPQPHQQQSASHQHPSSASAAAVTQHQTACNASQTAVNTGLASPLMAALQAQAQAQTFNLTSGHHHQTASSKNVASTATSVMSGTTGLSQQTHQMIRPGIITTGGTRVVSQMSQMTTQPQAAPLVLQQIQTPQGPITVAISATQLQALQSCGLGVSGPGLTLSNPTPAATNLGVTHQQGFVLNNHTADPSAGCQLTQVTQLQHQQQLCSAPMQLQLQPQQQQQQEVHAEQEAQPPQQQQVQPKVHSVNLEELLKQAGIMPEDSPSPPPPPPPPQTPPPLASPAEQQYQSVVTFAPMPAGVPLVQNEQQQQQQQVVDAVSQSQLIAQFQHPMMAASHGQLQTTQLKVALGQDGHFYIQRPVFPTVSSSGQMTLAHHPQVSFPVGCTVTSTATSSPGTVSTTTSQPPSIHSVMLQAAGLPQQVDQQTQMMTTTTTSDASSGMLPFTVQGINAFGLVSAAATTPTVTSSSVTSNAILSSMLSQNHPTLMQTLSNDAAGQGYLGKPAVIQQNPLLVQSLQTSNYSNASPGTASASAHNSSPDEQHQQICRGDAIGSTPSFYLSEFASVSANPPSAVPSSLSVASSSSSSSSTEHMMNTTPSTIPAPAQHQQINQIVAGYPVTSLPSVQKIQTIQLRPQDQEALQKIQAQLKAIGARGVPQTAQQVAQIQHLQSEQQKILAQGKVISVHQQPTIISQQHRQQLFSQLGTQSPFKPQPVVRPPRKKKKKKKPAEVPTPPPPPAPTPQQGFNVSTQSTQSNAETSANGVSLANFITQVGTSITAMTAMSSDQHSTTLVSTSATSLATTTTTTHMKIGNQIIALTPQQQRQAAAHHLQLVKNATASDQQQQQQQQQPGSGKQALIVKLQQQQQPSMSKSTATSHDSQTSTRDASSQSSAPHTFPTGILQFQTTGTSMSHLKSLPGSNLSDQLNRGIKRTATISASRANAFHQRVTLDQNAVLKPDCRTPFRSQEDACKRLLRYHVYSSKAWSAEEFQQDDEHFEAVSRQLLDKTSQMLNKYRYLLLRESMKETSTAERVMLERMFIQDENACLQQDRLAVKEGKELELPPPPDHWLEKLRLMGPLPSPPDPPKAIVNPITKVSSAIKQEPVDDEPPFTDGHSSSPPLRPGGLEYSSAGIRCKDEVVKKSDSAEAPSSRHKNYDEWAEIQKELEMYPLEHDEPAPGHHHNHLEFDDGGASLVDFEPPIPKAIIIKEDVDGPSSSYNGQHYHHHHSYHPSDQHHHHHHHHQRVGKIDHHSHHQGCDVTAKWGDSDEYRTEGQMVSDLLQQTTNFKSSTSPSLLDDDGLQDEEDLNAQVESAINSILNLQRLDDAGVRDAAFVASVVQQQCQAAAQLQSALFGSADDVDQKDDEEENQDLVEDDIDPEEAFESAGQQSAGAGDKTMDYDDEDVDDEAAAAAANMVDTCTYAQEDDGPSEMDVALDEAVKSILL